jgi:hypothetical protein
VGSSPAERVRWDSPGSRSQELTSFFEAHTRFINDEAESRSRIRTRRHLISVHHFGIGSLSRIEQGISSCPGSQVRVLSTAETTCGNKSASPILAGSQKRLEHALNLIRHLRGLHTGVSHTGTLTRSDKSGDGRNVIAFRLFPLVSKLCLTRSKRSRRAVS